MLRELYDYLRFLLARRRFNATLDQARAELKQLEADFDRKTTA